MRVWKSGGTIAGIVHVDVVHRADLGNPHQVDAADVGLGSAENTADLDKPISTDTQDALDLKADQTHVDDVTTNPHAVTKAQVGLGSAEDIADADKVVSDLTVTALALKQDLHANLTTITNAPSILGRVVRSKADGTVEWVEHTSIVSSLIDLTDITDATATNRFVLTGNGTTFAARLLTELDISDLGTYATAAALSSHEALQNNPHVVTTTQLNLENVANRSEAQMVAGAGAIFDEFATKSDTTHNHALGDLTGDTDDITEGDAKFATAAQLAQIATNVTDISNNALQSSLQTHLDDQAGNPHVVTKSEVGLANAENTTDLLKPVSTATAAALALKQNITTELTSLEDVSGSTENYVPTVNAGLTGFDLVALDSIGGLALGELDDTGTVTYGAKEVLFGDGVDEYASREIVEDDITADGSLWSLVAHNHNSDYGTLADVASNTTHRGLVAGNPHVVTATEVSLGNVENVNQATMVAGPGAIATEFATKRGIISTQTFSSTDTIAASSDDIFVVSTMASGTLTLPSAVAGIRVTVVQQGAGSLIVDNASGDDFYNPSTSSTTLSYVTGPGASAVFVAMDATTWYVMSDATLNERVAQVEDKPVMKVVKGVTQTIATSTFTQVVWGSADLDTHSGFSNANDDYTIPKAGWWRCKFRPAWDHLNKYNAVRFVNDFYNETDTRVESREYATPMQYAVDNPNIHSEPHLDCLLELALDDVIYPRVWHNEGTNETFNTGYASIYRRAEWTMEWVCES